MDTTYAMLAVLAAGALVVVAIAIRECSRGAKSVFDTATTVLTAVALLTIIWGAVGLQRSFLHGERHHIGLYLRVQEWGMIAWLLITIVGGAIRPFLDPKVRKEADELVKRYQEQAHDQ